MATVLTLSSCVIRGHVGNSAAVFILQRLGHTVWPFHTVYLSNHPGYSDFAGAHMEPELLHKNFAMFERHGWINDVDAILTGYLPSLPHVTFAHEVVTKVKRLNPECLFLCDPTLGDDPKGLYIYKKAALEIRDILLPQADIATPNRFELEWLTGKPIQHPEDILTASQNIPCQTVITTSAPSLQNESIDNHLISDTQNITASPKIQDNVPHDTGDCFAALFLGFLLQDNQPQDALNKATRNKATLYKATLYKATLYKATQGIKAILEASLGRDELDIIGTQENWAI